MLEKQQCVVNVNDGEVGVLICHWSTGLVEVAFGHHLPSYNIKMLLLTDVKAASDIQVLDWRAMQGWDNQEIQEWRNCS